MVQAFEAELTAWRQAHPGHGEPEQLAAFTPLELWRRAGGSTDSSSPEVSEELGERFRQLMVAAGYVPAGLGRQHLPTYPAPRPTM